MDGNLKPITISHMRQHVRVAVQALLHILILFSTTIMSSTSTGKKKAVWNDREIIALLNFLIEHHSEGEGGSFKKVVFNCAAEHVNGMNLGEPKTGKQYMGKWQSVC